MDSPRNREFDLIVYGATGFTGRLVSEYLCQRYGKADANGDRKLAAGGVRFALAARSKARMEEAVADMKKTLKDPQVFQALDGVALIEASAGNPGSLEAMTKRATVVVTTVGPYALHGRPLVAACLATGTHCCNITGEPNWVRDMIDEFHQKATDSGVKIVCFCGFDSVPSDIGAQLVVAEAKRQYPEGVVKKIDFRVQAMKGGFSGGTIASLLNVLLLPKSILERMQCPFFLATNSPHQAAAISKPKQLSPKNSYYDPWLRTYCVPWVMEAINSKVVHRSNFLLKYSYGRDLCYHEGLTVRNSWLWAKAITWTFWLQEILMAFRPFQFLVRKVLPKPGEGPSRELRDSGYFWMKCRGEVRDANGALHPILVRVGSDQGDGGYKETAKMLSECALAIAFPACESDAAATSLSTLRNLMPAPLPGGVLTPASAIGLRLAMRLNRAGMTFE
eukprot:Selendium_serpulae@DN6233_c1_g1_i1.p1